MLNIKVIHSAEKVSINPQDSGFSHGFALFETLLVEGGQLFFWARHWERLFKSAQFLELDVFLIDQEALVLEAIIALNKTQGAAPYALKLSLMPSLKGATLYIYTRGLEAENLPIRLSLNTVHPINEKAPLAGLKTHNYMENIWLLKEARAQGFDDYLRIDTQGRISETCIGNIFFVREGLIKTPSTASGVLPGVIRSIVLESEIVEACEIVEEDLTTMSAAFMTNSLRHISLVSEINTKKATFNFENTPANRRLIDQIESHLLVAQKSESIQLSVV